MNIKKIREKLGRKSQQELADLLGVKQQAVNYWETGEREIPLYIKKLINCLIEKDIKK